MALGATPDTAGAWLLIVLSQCAAVCTWQWQLALPSRALRGSQDVFLLPCRGCAVGDAFGQRTVRVVHKHSRRRMIMSFVLVSSVQVFVVLGLLQLVLPPSITGDVYIGDEPSTCYVQYFDEGCCPTDGRYTALLVTTPRADACRCVWLTTSPPWWCAKPVVPLCRQLHRRSCVMPPCSVPIARSGFHVSFAAAAPVPAHQRRRQHRVLLRGVHAVPGAAWAGAPRCVVAERDGVLQASRLHLPPAQLPYQSWCAGNGHRRGFAVCGGEGQLQGAWWRGRGWCR